jgi:hypothetical protein
VYAAKYFALRAFFFALCTVLLAFGAQYIKKYIFSVSHRNSNKKTPPVAPQKVILRSWFFADSPIRKYIHRTTEARGRKDAAVPFGCVLTRVRVREREDHDKPKDTRGTDEAQGNKGAF